MPSTADSQTPPKGITRHLWEWADGDIDALDALVPLVSDELHRLARAYLRKQPPNHTLQPTALVNELYLRLIRGQPGSWPDRAHFFAFAAKTMRNILVDQARARQTDKRGSGQTLLPLDESRDGEPERVVELIALNEALEALARRDPRQSRLVELRAFTGMSLVQSAEILGISKATASRDWAMAKAWLFRRLTFHPAS